MKSWRYHSSSPFLKDRWRPLTSLLKDLTSTTWMNQVGYCRDHLENSHLTSKYSVIKNLGTSAQEQVSNLHNQLSGQPNHSPGKWRLERNGRPSWENGSWESPKTRSTGHYESHVQRQLFHIFRFRSTFPFYPWDRNFQTEPGTDQLNRCQRTISWGPWASFLPKTSRAADCDAILDDHLDVPKISITTVLLATVWNSEELNFI